MKTSVLTITVRKGDDDDPQVQIIAEGNMIDMAYGICIGCEQNEVFKAIIAGAIAGGALTMEDIIEAKNVSNETDH